MSLFVLRDGYRIVTTPSGARVVHVRTGGSIELSSEEVLLFARATAGGVDSKDPQLRNVIKKFVTLGVLVSNEPSKSDARSPAGRPPSLGGEVAASSSTSGPRPPSVSPQVPASPSFFAAPPASAAPPSPAPGPSAASSHAASSIENALSSAGFASPSISPTGLAPPAPAPPSMRSTEIAPMKEARPSQNPQAAVAPGRPKLDDVVRLFRADLKIQRRVSSNLLDVADPQTGKTFPLYDFEISLARMLDGRRLYSDVIEAGQRLGIPVNFESLCQFVGQLERYGFLAAPGTPLPERSEAATWGLREKWDEGLRALFQTGLRMHRQGRYAEAVNYFDAMLQQDPQNPEALEMLEQSRQRLKGVPASNGEAALSDSDPVQISIAELLSKDDEAPSAPLTFEALPISPSQDEPPPIALDPPRPAAEALPPAAPRSKTGVWSAERKRPPPRPKIPWVPLGIAVCALAVVSAGGWYVISLQFESSADASRVEFKKRPKSGTPKNGAPATVASAPIIAGAPDAGVQVAAQHRMDVSLPRLSAQAPRDAGMATESSGAAAATSPADAGLMSRTAGATADWTAAADAGMPADESRSRWIAARIENRGRVTMAEITAGADGTVSWKAAPNQRVKRGDALGSLRGKGSSTELTLNAPKDGLFVPKVRSETEVASTEKIAAIVYHEAYLQALVADAQPEPGWSCEVFQAASTAKANCKIVEVVRRGSKSFMTATTEPTWFDHADDARVRVLPPH
ncbi:MAG TPA: tetratricopeptide repeat protein [Myxococcaceae bacterium]|nr:tetratricopeptide repeat protein [Myxococcaceae bacterium]